MARFISELNNLSTIAGDTQFLARDAVGGIDYNTEADTLLEFMQDNIDFPTEYIKSPMDYGATGDGIADDTVAVQACFDAAKYTLIDRVYAVSAVTCDKYVTCVSSGKLLNIAGSGIVTLTINSKRVGDVFVDGNGNNVTGVSFTEGLGYRQDADSVRVINLSAPADGVFNTGLRAYGDNMHVSNIYIEDMVNTGYSNGSVPQGLVIGGLRVNLGNFESKNTRSAIVLTAAAKFHIDNIDIYDCLDNGVYGFGSEGSIGTMTYRGEEEPFVASGCHLSMDRITTIGYCGTILRIQNNRYLDIGEVISTYPITTPFEEIKDNVALAFLGHRSSNTTTESIRIGRVTGDFAQSFIATGSGTGVTKILDIGSADVRLHWVDTTRNPSWDVTNWMDLGGVVKHNLRNFKIDIIDVFDELTTNPTQYFRQSFATIPEESLFENIDVTILSSDGSISPNGVYRGAGQSEKIQIVGARWQTIGGALYSRNANLGPRDSFLGDLQPSNGYWRKGQRFTVTNYDGTNGNHTYICTTSGIAGAGATFVALGEIITGTGSPVSVVTPNHLGQIYRDTSAAAGDRLWMAYGSTNAFWEQL